MATTVVLVALSCGSSDPSGASNGAGVTPSVATRDEWQTAPAASPPPGPTATPELRADIPSGALAFFFRVNLGSDTQNLKNLGGDISWESGAKGIVRYIPEIDRYDVIKTIVSKSYSKSSIYPVTSNGRLYTIRDWGSDWAVDDNSFLIEELDPVTGRSLGSVQFKADWFAISGDVVFHATRRQKDFWGQKIIGGQLMVASLVDRSDVQVGFESPRMYAAGDSLLSFDDEELRRHSTEDGSSEWTKAVEKLFIEDIWPYPSHILPGDSAVYWAVEIAPSVIEILALSPDGEITRELDVEFDPDETGFVVDEADGYLMFGALKSVKGSGLGLTKVFVRDPADGSIIEYPLEQFVPASKVEAGGGLQLLVLP